MKEKEPKLYKLTPTQLLDRAVSRFQEEPMQRYLDTVDAMTIRGNLAGIHAKNEAEKLISNIDEAKKELLSEIRPESAEMFEGIWQEIDKKRKRSIGGFIGSLVRNHKVNSSDLTEDGFIKRESLQKLETFQENPFLLEVIASHQLGKRSKIRKEREWLTRLEVSKKRKEEAEEQQIEHPTEEKIAVGQNPIIVLSRENFSAKKSSEKAGNEKVLLFPNKINGLKDKKTKERKKKPEDEYIVIFPNPNIRQTRRFETFEYVFADHERRIQNRQELREEPRQETQQGPTEENKKGFSKRLKILVGSLLAVIAITRIASQASETSPPTNEVVGARGIPFPQETVSPYPTEINNPPDNLQFFPVTPSPETTSIPEPTAKITISNENHSGIVIKPQPTQTPANVNVETADPPEIRVSPVPEQTPELQSRNPKKEAISENSFNNLNAADMLAPLRGKTLQLSLAGFILINLSNVAYYIEYLMKKKERGEKAFNPVGDLIEKIRKKSNR